MNHPDDRKRSSGSEGTEGIHRREFFRRAAVGGAGALAARYIPAAGYAETPAASKARVVVVKHSGVFSAPNRVDRDVIAAMIDAGVRELTGAEFESASWVKVAEKGDKVAIKYNTVGGARLETRPEIYEILGERLRKYADVEQVIAWDRNKLPKELLAWGSETYTLPSRGIKTKLRSIVTDWATCLINTPVVKMHWGTGITIAMKNHMGTNNNPADLHNWDDGMWKSIAELNALEPIRAKTRLIVADATRPLWDGGPGDRPANRWNYNALLFGFDPVAVDAVGLAILEKKREEVKGEPWPATHGRMKIEYAERIGVGVGDMRRIDVQEIKLG